MAAHLWMPFLPGCGGGESYLRKEEPSEAQSSTPGWSCVALERQIMEEPCQVVISERLWVPPGDRWGDFWQG